MERTDVERQHLMSKYFNFLALIEFSKGSKASDRKEGLVGIIDFIKTNLNFFNSKEAQAKFLNHLKVDFWEKTYSAIEACFVAEFNKAKKVTNSLEEAARCLCRFFVEILDGNDSYLFQRFSKRLRLHCQEIFSLELESNLFQACASHFFLLLKRLLKLKSNLPCDFLEFVFKVCMKRLVPEDLLNEPEKLRMHVKGLKINFAELLSLSVEAMGFELSTKDSIVLFKVCASYLSSLAQNEQFTTVGDSSIFDLLISYLRYHGIDAMDLCTTFGKRMINDVIRSSLSTNLLRNLQVVDFFHALGTVSALYQAHHGNDWFVQSEWLNMERLCVNIFSFVEKIHVKDGFDNLSKRCETYPSFDSLHQSSFASCAGDYLFWGEFGLKKPPDCGIQFVWDRAISGSESTIRTQHLSVLHALFAQQRLECQGSPYSLIEMSRTLVHRLETVLTLPMEMFWILKCLGSISRQFTMKNEEEKVFWNQTWEVVFNTMMKLPTLVLVVCGMQTLGSMAQWVHSQLISQSLEDMWKEGLFLRFKFPGSFLAEFLCDIPNLHDVLVKVSCKNDLIAWAWERAIELDEEKHRLVFVKALVHMVTLRYQIEGKTVDLGQALMKMSRFYPLSVSSSVALFPAEINEEWLSYCVQELFPKVSKSNYPKVLVLCQHLLVSETSKRIFQPVLSTCFSSVVQSVIVGGADKLLEILVQTLQALKSTLFPMTDCDRLFCYVQSVLESMMDSNSSENETKPQSFAASLPKREKRVKMSEDVEADEMFGSQDTKKASSSSASFSFALPRSSSDDVALTNSQGLAATSFSSNALPPPPELVCTPVAVVPEDVFKHLCMLLSLTTSQAKATLDFFEKYLNSWEPDDVHYMALAEARISLYLSQPIVDIQTQIGFIMNVSAEQTNRRALQSCIGLLHQLATHTPTFPHVKPKKLQSWFAPLVSFTGPIDLHMRCGGCTSGMVLPRSLLVDFLSSLLLLGAKSQHPPDDTNIMCLLTTNLFLESLNHSKVEIRNLAILGFPAILSMMRGDKEKQLQFLDAILSSNYDQESNSARTYLLAASTLAICMPNELFLPVLLRFVLALTRRPNQTRRRVLIMRMLTGMLPSLGYVSLKQVFLVNAWEIWKYYLQEVKATLESFPFELFGYSCLVDLLRGSMATLLPWLLMAEDKAGVEDVMHRVEGNKTLIGCMQEYKAAVFGILHPLRNSTLGEECTRGLLYYAQLANVGEAPISKREMVSAIKYGLTLLCFQHQELISMGMDRIASFLVDSHQGSKHDLKTSMQLACRRINMIDVMVHFKYLLEFPESICWLRVLNMMHIVMNNWVGAGTTTMKYLQHLHVYILLLVSVKAKDDQVRDHALRLVENATTLSPELLMTCQIMKNPFSQELSLRESVQRLLALFPHTEVKRISAPGNCTVSSAIWLSISPNVSQSLCVFRLTQLLKALHTTIGVFDKSVQQSSSEEPPLELLKSLRPNFDSGVSSHQRQDPCLLTSCLSAKELPRLIRCILDLCGPDVSETIHRLASACLTHLNPYLSCFQEVSAVDDSVELNEDAMLVFKMRVLEWLFEFLNHENASLASCAVFVLDSMFHTQSGRDAANLLENGSLCKTLVLDWVETMDLGKPNNAIENGSLLYGTLQTRRHMLHHLDEGPPNSLSFELWERIAEPLWICAVCDLLCQDESTTSDEVLKLLAPMCAMEPHFASMVFPYLCFSCVKDKENRQAQEDFSSRFSQVLSNSSAPRGVHCLLLNTLNFLRGRRIAEHVVSSAVVGIKPALRSQRQNKVKSFEEDYRMFWIKVDIQQLALVALACDMPSSVILAAEVWQELSSNKALGQEVLLKAYRLLGDKDAVLSVQRSAKLMDNIETRKFNGDWLGALIGFDAQRLQQWDSNQVSLLQGQALSLARLGLVDSMKSVLAGHDSPLLQELQREACWRSIALSGNATELRSYLKDNELTTIHSILVQAFTSLRFRDQDTLKATLNTGMNLLVNQLHQTENLENLSLCVDRLSILNDFQTPAGFKSSATTVEHCLVREGILRLSGQFSLLGSHLVSITEQCRAKGDAMGAALAMDRLRRIDVTFSNEDSIKLDVQDALNCWARGDAETALRIAKECHQYVFAHACDTRLKPGLKVLIGWWLAKSSSASSQTVREEWFAKAIGECHLLLTSRPVERAETEKLLSQIHLLMGQYLDSQFRGLDSRIKSPEFKFSLGVQRQREVDLQRLNEQLETTTDRTAKAELKATVARLTRECQNDKEELERATSSHAKLLLLTVSHLLHALESTREGNSRQEKLVFRVIHLWFHHRTEVIGLNALIQERLVDSSLPSKYWIPLVYQIISRIDSIEGGEDPEFQVVIHALISKLAMDHPFQTLPHLFSILNSNKMPEGSIEANSKAKAAQVLLLSLSKKKDSMKDICGGLQSMYKAFISLAFYTCSTKFKAIQTSDCEEFTKFKKRIPWGKLPLPCFSPNPDDGQVTLAGIEDTYKITDQGLNAPKILTVLGSDGKRRRLLVKGKDDLRQDFIMELILGHVSQLLQNQSHRMRLRTYNVLPLTPAAGLIEWVENTTSFGGYLYGSINTAEYAKSAHGRHNPGDKSFYDVISLFKAANDDVKQDKLEVFRTVCKQFKPVFRHFFFERFGNDPIEWYKRRDAYTRSTAANSMVGMILGIGDRHSQNILIDEHTGEVIHIDFGVTFEQGKALRTPETVPFRLTRDVIDGFGVSGVSGVFTQACVDTLLVLRENADSILTICEVFVHDPLHKWTVSSLKQHRIEAREEEAPLQLPADALGSKSPLKSNKASAAPPPPATMQENVEAGRLLNRLKQKLEGHVDDDGLPLNVEAQVKRVIQEATDESNLCRLYYGWAPFL